MPPRRNDQGRLIQVALPLPLFRTFVYSVDGELSDRVHPGSRVVVPLRDGKEIGICVGEGATPAPGVRVKKVLDAPGEDPVLAPGMLRLCEWISDYYVAPLGMVVRSALPAMLTGVGRPDPPRKRRRIATVRREVPTLLERSELFARAPRQRETYELLESLGGRSPVEHLVKRLGVSYSVLNALRVGGLISIDEETVARDPFAARPAASSAPVVPTSSQLSVIAAAVGAKAGEVFLLHGITGSGKTLVYIELLREIVHRRGRTAIVLVPEISLTPQTVDRFRAVFGDSVAVLHSALSDGERYDAWLALRSGEKRIAVGARSAVFAPLTNLGAVVVDEEHEWSYKQGETPRYHAREVAVVRAQGEGAVVVLGTATPSLESWSNSLSGKYRLLELPERVGFGRLPSVEVVDLRSSRQKSAANGAGALPDGSGHPPGDGDRAPAVTGARDFFRSVFSERLESELRARLESGEQSVLLLNRRGYASFVQCGACGDVSACPNCSIALTYHRAPESLVCHYCLHKEPPLTTCRRCGGVVIRQRGVGTQQVERLVNERFPQARVARMDVDTTSGKWAHAEILDRVGRGDVDILLGTQMIAKGLDFPNVTLVGVVDADVGLNLPDFRAPERSFQLMAQVAGRAGRGEKGGHVIIQTRVPNHYAVRAAVRHDVAGFVAEELRARRSPQYPPHTRLANVIFSGIDEKETADLAVMAGDWITRLVQKRCPGSIALVGPAPCPVERIKNRWRWHVLMKSAHPADISRVGRYFMERFDVPARAELRVAFDRDPLALL